MSQKVEVTFLGTGTSQGIPVIGSNHPVCLSTNKKDKRLRCSIFVKYQNLNLVIDTGPDFRQQMLNAKVNKLNAVLFTHEHKDHTAGLDDIRPFNFMQQTAMPVYAEARVLNQLKQEYSYIFSDFKYPGVPSVTLHEITNKPFNINNIEIIPIRVWHYKLPVLGFRFGNFTYITDANKIEESEKKKIKGSKVLVLNALRNEPHISHFTLNEAINLANELEVEKAYFTHISHNLGFHDKVSKSLPKNRFLAYDGLKISIN